MIVVSYFRFVTEQHLILDRHSHQVEQFVHRDSVQPHYGSVDKLLVNEPEILSGKEVLWSGDFVHELHSIHRIHNVTYH